MATLKTTDVSNVREDLGNYISMISPEETPFRTEIGKTTAKNTYHETLTDELAAPNKDNAAVEGADAPLNALTGPARVGNWTQIFTKDGAIARTLESVDKAGAKSEKARQIAKKGLELNRDIEAALISSNASVATGARKLGGAEAWIKTNAFHGTGGATAGFSNGIVGAVTNATAPNQRVLTEAMFNEMVQKVWNAGGDPSLVLTPGDLKVAISKFNGNATKYQEANKSKTIYSGVDVYVSNFGTHSIIPHRYMSATTVIAFDKSLWNVAVLDGVKKTDLAKTGDADKFQLVTELTLECLNEAGNGKIADVKAA
ncbi:DUF5309 domain-containing protein [Agrobacterium rosae]|uniref:DUF5309 domain-containing protein n=1 Tax=Agrobacterium rosae TaxID=1972867 RepID=UPI003BA248DD